MTKMKQGDSAPPQPPPQQGFQRRCTFSSTCSYVTAVWPEDDASAEWQLYTHKWANHEPETESTKK